MTKQEAQQIFTKGNHKLDSGIITFDIPATQDICGRICEGCYAIKAQKLYKAVLPSRERKLELSKQPSFVGLATSAINVLNPNYVRLHASGEFYSQEYVDKWYEIAKQLPSRAFYAYTKRLSDFNFQGIKALPNFVLVNSLHGGRINYGALSDNKSNLHVCPDHSTKEIICGSSCTYCMTKEAQHNGVFFKKH